MQITRAVGGVLQSLVGASFGLADFVSGVYFEEPVVAEIVAMVIALAAQLVSNPLRVPNVRELKRSVHSGRPLFLS
jgi:hypothetical protein